MQSTQALDWSFWRKIIITLMVKPQSCHNALGQIIGSPPRPYFIILLLLPWHEWNFLATAKHQNDLFLSTFAAMIDILHNNPTAKTLSAVKLGQKIKRSYLPGSRRTHFSSRRTRPSSTLRFEASSLATCCGRTWRPSTLKEPPTTWSPTSSTRASPRTDSTRSTFYTKVSRGKLI